MQAIRDGTLDAFVYDRPLLTWTINQDFRRSIKLLDVVFDQQHYAFALPSGSPLRKPVSVALLKEVRSRWWGDTLHRYLGGKGSRPWPRTQISSPPRHGGLNRLPL